MCVRVRACVRAGVRACLRACVHASVCTSVAHCEGDKKECVIMKI